MGKNMSSGLGFVRGYKCVAWLLLFISLFLSANARSEFDNLSQNLLLQYLTEPTLEREQYLTTLQAGTISEQLESVDVIQLSVADFWRQKNVPLSFDKLNSGASIVEKNISLEPEVDDYLWVVNYLRKLIWLSQTQPWPAIEPGGLLRLGDGHQSIKLISQRLWLLGDAIEYAADEVVYKEDLAQSVKRFQARHGLTPDSVIGPKTLFWLNQTPLARGRLLAKSFVEKTAYSSQLSQPYLLINIPAFNMVLVEDNQVVLQSKVIVGKSYRQTPVMQGNISNIVLNPTWTVPRQILRKDVLPLIHKDGHYLAEKKFDVFDYEGHLVEKSAQQWQEAAVGRFPYRVVQRPGTFNSLGRYKFHFKNDLDVYLHDTPNPELYRQSQRALSSGCVRIEKVQLLADWFARYLIIDKRIWNRMQLNYDKTQWFALSATLPVHLVYWRAWVDDEHVAQYRDDIYDVDSVDVMSLIGQHAIFTDKVITQ
jgi:murein L,D-transpeptidase YcbB/YkuD